MKNILEKPLAFAIRKSEVDTDGKRWDPGFYKFEYLENIRKLHSCPWQIKKLAEIISKITKGETPLWRGHEYVQKGVPFLRVQNLKEDGLDLSDLVFISEDVHKSMRRSQLKEGDVLFSMAGTIGVAVVYDKNVLPIANINQAIARIVVKDNIDRHFLAAFLNTSLGRLQSLRALTAAAQPNINFEQIKSIEIPLPPMELQTKLAEKLKESYRIRKKRRTDAEKTLASIHEYIATTLDIKTDSADESTTKNTYRLLHSQLEDRLDPYYYSNLFVANERNILSGSYPVKTFGEIMNVITGGATPLAKSDAYTSEENGVPFLRIQNVAEDEIDLSEVRYITREIHETMLKRSQLRRNDLLLTITGRIGTSAIVPASLAEGNINQHIVKITLKESVNPYYVSAFLNSKIGNLEALRRVTGTTRIALDYEAIRSILIPVPPIEVQNEIVGTVASIRQRSKDLVKDGDRIVEKAKKSVEAAIVGR